MNKYYFIVPGVLLAVFLGYERHYQRLRDVRERAQAEAIAADLTQKEEARQKQIALARLDTDQRTADREKQDREKADKKKSDYEALVATLQSQADQHETEAAKLAQTIHDLAVQVDVMRAKQQAIDREALELRRQLDLKQIDLRNAELDGQITTSRVTARLEESL